MMRRFHDAALPHLDERLGKSTRCFACCGPSRLSDTNAQYRALSGARNERCGRADEVTDELQIVAMHESGKALSR